MKKFISLVLIAMMMFTMSACGSSDTSNEDALEGLYLVSNVVMFGEEMNYADLVYFEMAEGTYLEFYGDNTAKLALIGEDAIDLEVDFASKTLTDMNDESINFELDGDSITLTSDEMESMTFTLEGSSEWDEIMAVPGTMETAVDDAVDNDMSLSDEEFVSPTTSINNPSYWYGYMNIGFYEGNGVYAAGDYDVWAVISEDEVGTFFEIYETMAMDTTPLVSYYITLEDTVFEPVISADAWAFDNLITEEDSFDFSAYLINGSFYISHEYEDDDESFYASFTFREEGTPWDISMEILPPGYDTYGPGY